MTRARTDNVCYASAEWRGESTRTQKAREMDRAAHSSKQAEKDIAVSRFAHTYTHSGARRRLSAADTLSVTDILRLTTPNSSSMCFMLFHTYTFLLWAARADYNFRGVQECDARRQDMHLCLLAHSTLCVSFVSFMCARLNNCVCVDVINNTRAPARKWEQPAKPWQHAPLAVSFVRARLY